VKRILFVDDENKILDGIRRSLRADRERWDVQFAVGGEAALQAFAVAPFDVIVSDMRMPGMDGATLLGHIRDRFPSTARIVLSGYSDGGMATRAIPVAHRFLAKPCDGVELQATLERVCILQDLLSSAELRRMVGSIGELPSLSGTYHALLEALKDTNVSIRDVAKIIEQDMGMSAKVLQLVNSAFFGLAQTVTSLQSAAAYLGMETLKNLALATETFRIFVPDARIPPSICESLQQHAHRTATIARKLPQPAKTLDVTVVSALLHDVGRLILASQMPDKFCAVLARARERGCEEFEAEEELLGISHAELGAYLLGLWGFPTLAVEAIAHHHRPTRIPHSGFDSSVALYVADVLEHEIEVHPEDSTGAEISESVRSCLEKLGILGRLAEFRGLAMQVQK
jgi:HD-like signal output (HDOD) protein